MVQKLDCMTRCASMPKPAAEGLDQIIERALDEAQPGARTRDIAEATVDRCNSSLGPQAREWAIEDLMLLLRRRRAQRRRRGKRALTRSANSLAC